MNAAPALDPEHVREVVSRVLSSSEFSGVDSSWSSLLDRIGDWISSAFQQIGKFMAGLPGWLFWLVMIGMIGTLIAVFAHSIYSLLRAGTLRRAVPGRGPKNAAAEALGVRALDFEELRAACDRAATQQNWERVVRLAYASAILWLDRVGQVRFLPSRTNHEYLAELARSNSAAPSRVTFERMTRDFEHVVYGARAADAQLGGRVLRDLGTLCHEAGPGAR